MNFRLRQERNAFVFLVVVVTPLLLLSAPLPYLSKLATANAPGARAERARLDTVSMDQAFVRADRNGDGFIDASEAAQIPGLLPIFAIVDVDGDGKIDRSELARVRPTRSRTVEART
ncbi:MAG TPA: EF-hand domain-containing protein [Burkholderiales bacterium]|nr:EF-hand domain-containing protein [Burkholderiales bacterium]